MGLGNIQISEVYAYMRMFHIDDEQERRLLLDRIQILDTAYMEYNSEKLKDKQKKSPAKKGKR
ncbi:MAG: hypothetical protein DRI97_04455 [Bacteroidetes bacterium]|nr:MAG: hypothetical protein DRI97_04455 [Bacteroidota bacterium]